MKDLDKRYTSKYGESPVQNLKTIKEIGLPQFIETEKKKWKCGKCGQLLCVHREVCLICGNKNEYFPQIKA
jgi:rubrerythrin